MEASEKHEHFLPAAVVEDVEDQDNQDHQDRQDHLDRKDRRARKDSRDRKDRRAGKDRQARKGHQHQEACRDLEGKDRTDSHQTDHYKHTQQLEVHQSQKEAEPKR